MRGHSKRKGLPQRMHGFARMLYGQTRPPEPILSKAKGVTTLGTQYWQSEAMFPQLF